MGEKGEGTGGKGGGNWEWGTPLSTPSLYLENKLIMSSDSLFNNQISWASCDKIEKFFA